MHKMLLSNKVITQETIITRSNLIYTGKHSYQEDRLNAHRKELLMQLIEAKFKEIWVCYIETLIRKVLDHSFSFTGCFSWQWAREFNWGKKHVKFCFLVCSKENPYRFRWYQCLIEFSSLLAMSWCLLKNSRFCHAVVCCYVDNDCPTFFYLWCHIICQIYMKTTCK